MNFVISMVACVPRRACQWKLKPFGGQLRPSWRSWQGRPPIMMILSFLNVLVLAAQQKYTPRSPALKAAGGF
jgi:hypothetical protein